MVSGYSAERLVIEAMFSIVDKDRRVVDFILNNEQAKLDARISKRNLVPKARQLGISAYYLGRGLAQCLGIKNTRAVIISHDAEATTKLLDRVHWTIDNIRGPSPALGISSRNEISFPKTDSTIYIGTAGDRDFGRGDTINFLHGSEVAFWSNAKKLMAGLLQAVTPNGEVHLESTGNGAGGYFYNSCMRAQTGNSLWTLHFMNWLEHPEYQQALSEDEKMELIQDLRDGWEENKLYQMGVTLEQLAWRRRKLEELDYDLQLFKQEYPISLDECFQTSGRSIFPAVNYDARVGQWIKIDDQFWALAADVVSRTSRYVIGADVAAGVGQDRSCAEIFDLVEFRQVGEWVSDSTDPNLFAHKLKELGDFYRGAYIGVESNNHGLATLLKLVELYPPHLIHSSVEDSDSLVNYGVKTTKKTKPIILNSLRQDLAHELVIYSPVLRSELTTFVQKEDTKKLEAEDGCYDDTVIAAAIASYIRDAAALILNPPAYRLSGEELRRFDEFSLEGILAGLQKRRSASSFPIPNQVYLSGRTPTH